MLGIINKIWQLGKDMGDVARRNSRVYSNSQTQSKHRQVQSLDQKCSDSNNRSSADITNNNQQTSDPAPLLNKKQKTQPETTQFLITNKKQKRSNKALKHSKRITTQPSKVSKHIRLPTIASPNLHIQLQNLYDKKTMLLKKLQRLNQQQTKVKIQQAYSKKLRDSNNYVQKKVSYLSDLSQQSPVKYNKNKLFGSIFKPFQIKKTKNNHLPQTLRSQQKNRQVLQFIQRMHRQSLKRQQRRLLRQSQAQKHVYSHLQNDSIRNKQSRKIEERIKKPSFDT